MTKIFTSCLHFLTYINIITVLYFIYKQHVFVSFHFFLFLNYALHMLRATQSDANPENG